MESMRSLNSSLPSSRPTRAAPPEELLQAFRSAALSVTNLYKSAATNQLNARSAGYQDALEDLLKFLDRENLGLQDGEGWRVREWATARYDGTATRLEDAESNEEQDVEVASGSISQEGEDAAAAGSEPVTNTEHAARQDSEEDSDAGEQSPIFHFGANQTQSETSMQTDGLAAPVNVEEASSSSQSAPIRVEVLNRNTKSSSRTYPPRHGHRSNPRDFTFTAGTKRKIQFPDFFDISSLNEKQDGLDGGGGPKRGRYM